MTILWQTSLHSLTGGDEAASLRAIRPAEQLDDPKMPVFGL